MGRGTRPPGLSTLAGYSMLSGGTAASVEGEGEAKDRFGLQLLTDY